MQKRLPLFLLIGGIILFVIAFMFYQKSENIKKEADALRSITTPSTDPYENEAAYEPEPEPVYDPADLDQTPPGVTPFVLGSICYFHWGTQMRQYCEGGDGASLDIVEGTSQDEEMRTLKMCLDEMIQRIDAYDDPDKRPMDSEIPLNELNRKALSCNMTGTYGSSPVFEKSSIAYMIKEHVESGNISRLENR